MDAILTPSRPDLVSEANHRVANSLTLLSGLVRMQARAAGRAAQPFSNAEVRLMFDGVAARIATVGQLHRMLAHLPLDGAVDLGAHIRDLGNTLVAAFSSEQQPVLVEHHGAECHVLTTNVQPLTLILCELLTTEMTNTLSQFLLPPLGFAEFTSFLAFAFYVGRIGGCVKIRHRFLISAFAATRNI